jgi:hypothetical protein
LNSQNSFYNSNGLDIKKLYKEFVKIFLKIKFEKIQNNHFGQKIPEKILFKECIRLDVPPHKYKEFIEEELKYPEKYDKYTRLSKFDRKRIPEKNKIKPQMEIINEENF